ncbi:hypothetical protein F0562_006073 [Nyssa sinensis]|uniref:SANTA domain-containing protein n=1 Tax=Nyssa sinensis TaxID=561372 RepID=A0A5J5AM60_9ASTE|nr:hypothetical protein F0562_006073 [Nyssa sinensis]
MANPARAVTNQSRNTTGTICSSILRTVYLHDWWLIKAEMDSKSRRLGVGGFASREGQGIRAFQSAAIIKRHDTVTLETVDGITVTLSGFINRSLTQTGFPPEVCNHFLFGFPYYWEEYAARYFSEEYTNKAVPSRISSLQWFNMSTNDDANSFLPVSLDDLPVTRIRDLLMYSLGDSEHCALTKNIFNDMLQTYSGSALKHDGASIHSNKDSNCPVMTEDSVPDETPSTRKKTKVEQKSRGDNDTPHATDMGAEEFQKSIDRCKMGVISSGKGIATRSMHRLKNTSNKQEDNLPSNTYVKCGT